VTGQCDGGSTVTADRDARAQLRSLALFCFVVALLAPLATLLLYSFAERFSTTAALPTDLGLRWYRQLLDDGRVLGALWTSLRLATAATAIALLAGLPAAWLLASRRVPGGAALELTALLRTAVPIIVLGVGTAAMLFRIGAIDTWWALTLAHAAGGVPFVVWTVRPALAGLDPEADEAARDLGAGLLRRMALALRSVGPAVTAGALFAFLFSMDEFAVTFLVAGIDIVTLPILLYGALQRSSVQAAAAVAVVLLVPSAMVALAGLRAVRRSERALVVSR
jgi:putative spermidine/putrescine transport system permease protein